MGKFSRKNYRNLIVVHCTSSEFVWVVGGLVREALSSENQNLFWNISFDRRIYLLNPKFYLIKRTKKNGEINIYTSFSLYLSRIKKSNNNSQKVVIINQIQDISPFQNRSNIKLLNQASKVIVQNQQTKNILISHQVRQKIIQVYPGPINRNRFFPGEKKNSYVLISGDFKPRKNPSKILECINKNKDLNFVIHGRNLSFFEDYKNTMPNLILKKWNFADQPKLMREASVFLNLSILEGGPISILEALSSGTPVIATDTGFAHEIINLGIGSVIPIEFDHMELRRNLIKWIDYSKKHKSVDFLNGQYNFTDFRNMLIEKDVL